MSAAENAVLTAAEESLDKIEATLDTIEKATPPNMNLNGTTKGQQIGIVVGCLVLGAVVGGGVTYLAVKKRLELKYDKISAEEIEAAKQYYRGMAQVATNEEAKSRTPEEILAELHGEEGDPEVQEAAVSALKSYGGHVLNPEAPAKTEAELVDPEEAAARVEKVEGRVVEQELPKPHNIFTNVAPVESEDGWDYEVETRIREENPGAPYIIHHDEFYENDKDFEQAQLTYFAGDDTLVDDKQAIVPDIAATVGEDNVLRFGHGSKDKNIVYIRNERLELDLEVIHSSGKYQVEVLGFEDPDDADQGPRKFRGHDE